MYICCIFFFLYLKIAIFWENGEKIICSKIVNVEMVPVSIISGTGAAMCAAVVVK
jgi:hypothetical protein